MSKQRTDTRPIYGDYNVSNDTFLTGLNNNDIIIGPSGAGKTRGYVIPYIRDVDNESLLVTDCKGMLYSSYGKELEKKGYKVYELDFTSEEEKQFGFNPFDLIGIDENTGNYSQKDINALAEIICGEEDNFKADKFWGNATKMFLGTLISYVLEALPAKYHNFNTVQILVPYLMNKASTLQFDRSRENRKRIQDFFLRSYNECLSNMDDDFYPVNPAENPFENEEGDADIFAVEDSWIPENRYKNSAKNFSIQPGTKIAPNMDMMMEDLALLNPDSMAVKQYRTFKDTFAADKTISSIVLLLAERLQKVCTNANTTLIKAGKTIDFTMLGKEKTAIFLKVSDNDRSNDLIAQVLYAQVLQLLISQADKNENNSLDVPTRFIFDDFASGAIIPDFDNIISVIRSREIYASIIIQSISQLNDKYGLFKASTIINNCDHMVYLGGQDIDTINFVAQKANAPMEDIVYMPVKNAYVFERGSRTVLMEL